MAFHSPIRVLVLAAGDQQHTAPLETYLRATACIALETSNAAGLPGNFNDYRVVIVDDPTRLSAEDSARLAQYVQHGGSCVGLLHAARPALPDLFGVQVGAAGPRAEIRARFSDNYAALARRMPDPFFVTDTFLPLLPADEATEPLLFTVWQHQRAVLATARDVGDGRVACLALQAVEQPLVQQLIYRLVRNVARLEEPAPLGVAVLGYGPISYVHASAATAVPGLRFHAVCDLNEARLAEARAAFPDIRAYSDARDLAADPSVDLVVVATAPNLHARLATDLLRAGKHVVCEKPLCITRAEADALIAVAAQHDRLVTSHQNRRWDQDFLSIQHALRSGSIGEPFYLEAFVGGYFHPCDFWHSHAPISGGALYDWGAHYVDSLLNLFPGETATVRSTAHKRVWHDVTNADQERVQITFASGCEAEFTYSEIAAIRKPKWYMLGTEGAIVGHWREETMRDPDRLRFFREEAIPVTEITPRLTLQRRSADGQLAAQELPLVEPRPFAYHLQLADHLLTGEPLQVTAQQAARVVSVLEAAARSARNGGTVEELRV